MPVMLDKVLKRELALGGTHYVLTISPEGFKLAPKGRRIGVELAWQDLLNGEAALAVALNASLQALAMRERRAAAKPQGMASPAVTASRTRARARRSGTSSRSPRARGRPRGR